MIGSLQYLTQTRSDIANAVSIVVRFQFDSKESHYVVVKRIFIYLKSIPDFGLWYDRSSDFTLCAYTNVDWAGSMDDIKHISGGSSFLGGISYFTKHIRS